MASAKSLITTPHAEVCQNRSGSRKLLATLSITLGVLLALSSAAAQPAADTRLSLSGQWQFTLARTPEQAERLAHFYEPAFDAQAFRPIPVPSNWALEGFEEPMYGRLSAAGEGFYLHNFQVPDALTGKRVLLHFDGVWSSAEVWLNAIPLGRHDSGFTSFAFDVTQALKPGENRLAVRVRQLTKDYLFDTNDDWSLGGIFRDVWLENMPLDRYIDRVETSTTFDEQFQDADLNIRVLVMQSRNRAVASDYALRLALTGPDGKTVEQDDVPVPAHPNTGRDTLYKMRVRAPAKWTAETPSLYHLRVDLLENGQVTHSRSHAVGFRQVSVRGGVLRVNGQPIKLRGVCRHDEYPDVGIATRREHWLQDIQLMKAANINAVRTVHYPPAQGFIDLCDEMGMWVEEECPMGYGGDLGSDPSFAASTLLRAYETVTRDRNHPSIIIWSVGNENPLTAQHLASMRAVKGWDSTRPVLLPWHRELWMPPEVDILAPHYPTAAEAEALTAASDRPVVSTEYTHALGEVGFGGLEDTWRGLTDHPAGAGGFIWMWQDQGLKRIRHTDHGDEPYILLNPEGIDGIVRADRSPQRDYWETKAVYAPVDIAAATLPFQPGQATVRVPVRNDFDFSDLATVEIRWKLMADDRQLAARSTRAQAAPHTVGAFDLPLAAITKVEPGVAYYMQISFLHPDGGEITERSVELLPAGPILPREKPSVPVEVRRGSTVSVTAGRAVYEFDSKTAALTSVKIDGRPLITACRPTIWRAPNSEELAIYKRTGHVEVNLPDLDHYSTRVKSWRVTQEGGGAIINATAEHRVDERNVFAADYQYRVLADGSLCVRYSIRPTIQAPWIPEVGMMLQGRADLGTLRWLGLGPLDAYPNLKMAAIFGLWTGQAGAERAQGTKAGVRWAELLDSAQSGFRVAGSDYVRLESPGRLRVLTAVEGRPSKFRRPDPPTSRLDVGPDTVIRGGFILTPVEGKP
jgi:beta-galactosidase